MKELEKEDIWEMIINYGIATESELQLVTDVAGYSVEVLNDVIYARTGYWSIEQFEECECN